MDQFNSSERKYYISWLRFKGRNFYIIWYSDELDGIVLEKPDKLLTSINKTTLITYASKHQLKIEEDKPTLINLDIAYDWVKNPSKNIDCEALLNAWNMFTDVSTSLKVNFQGNIKRRIRNRVYDKLFFGINLPAITPPGRKYTPKWNKFEIEVLRSILAGGFQLLSKSLY